MKTFCALMIASLNFLLFFSASPILAVPAPGDEHWDSQFGPVGANNNLFGITVCRSKVYVGGYLSAAGNTRANFVAAYDGTNWGILNNGVSGTVVESLATDGTNVYAGGWFTDADNSGAQYIARWDGTNWFPLGGGIAGIVSVIKIIGTNLYAGGYFTTASGITVNGIARWDGMNWSALGGGITGSGSPSVAAIESDGVNIYVGGTFTSAGGVSATNIAVWNGSAWTALGGGPTGPVQALLFKAGTLYVGGSFTNLGSVNLTNLAVCIGATWSALPGGGANGSVMDLATDGTNIYAGGLFTRMGGVAASCAAKWNGGNWVPLGAGIQGFGVGGPLGVYRMSFAPDGRLYAAGNFNIAGAVGVSHVAGWDGTNWFALGGATSKGVTHFGHTVYCLAPDGANLYAGGNFTEAGNALVNGIAKWDGTNWLALGSGVVGNGTVYAIAVTNGVVYAGGNFTNIGGTTVKYVAAWDGTNWSQAGSGFDNVVKSLTFHRGVLFAGGSFDWRGDASVEFHGIAQFGGGDWAVVPTMSSWRINNSFNALVSDGTNLYVGGDFYIGWGFAPPNPNLGANVDYVGRWDGTNWWSFGTELNAAVNALALQNGYLFAGGSFTLSYSGGTSEKRIARWDGSVWTTVGTGFTNGSVQALATSSAMLYAAGNFTNGPASAFGQIARWNGTNWSALGSGLLSSPGTPFGASLAVKGNDLYLGGNFLFAGDKPAISIARWNDQLNFYPAPNLQLTRSRWLANGQFQCRVAGTSGQTYILQDSTNFSVWTPLFTNTVPLYDFTDSSPTNFPMRYYRAMLPP